MDSLQIRIEKIYRYLYGLRIVNGKGDFAKKIGVSKSYISDAFADRQRKLTQPLLEKIAKIFSKYINEEYAINGEGEVAKNDSTGGIPHFEDVTVAAGYFDGFQTPANASEIRTEPFGMSEAEFSIGVKGDSMYPEIQEGDTLYLCQHLDRDNIPLNKLYVVDSEDGGGVVKQLVKTTPQYFYLHSLNPEFRDIRIHRKDVRHLYRVVGVTRKY